MWIVSGYFSKHGAPVTQIRKIGTTATDKVEAGMAATARSKEKVVKYGASVKSQ